MMAMSGCASRTSLRFSVQKMKKGVRFLGCGFAMDAGAGGALEPLAATDLFRGAFSLSLLSTASGARAAFDAVALAGGLPFAFAALLPLRTVLACNVDTPLVETL